MAPPLQALVEGNYNSKIETAEAKQIKSGLRTLNKREREQYVDQMRAEYSAAVVSTKAPVRSVVVRRQLEKRISPRSLGGKLSPNPLSSGRTSALRVEDIIEEAVDEDRENLSSQGTAKKNAKDSK